ncbi:hypothetical protein KC356_g354 [Hortaea werneckii]|nr:hypothetical protein KC356_g354 [Hortaea werneckii]
MAYHLLFFNIKKSIRDRRTPEQISGDGGLIRKIFPPQVSPLIRQDGERERRKEERNNDIRTLLPHPLTTANTPTSSHQPQPQSHPPIINLDILIRDPQPLIHHSRGQDTAPEVAGEALAEVVDDSRERVAFRVEEADGAVVLLRPRGRRSPGSAIEGRRGGAGDGAGVRVKEWCGGRLFSLSSRVRSSWRGEGRREGFWKVGMGGVLVSSGRKVVVVGELRVEEVFMVLERPPLYLGVEGEPMPLPVVEAVERFRHLRTLPEWWRVAMRIRTVSIAVKTCQGVADGGAIALVTSDCLPYQRRQFDPVDRQLKAKITIDIGAVLPPRKKGGRGMMQAPRCPAEGKEPWCIPNPRQSRSKRAYHAEPEQPKRHAHALPTTEVLYIYLNRYIKWVMKPVEAEKTLPAIIIRNLMTKRR